MAIEAKEHTLKPEPTSYRRNVQNRAFVISGLSCCVGEQLNLMTIMLSANMLHYIRTRS